MAKKTLYAYVAGDKDASGAVAHADSVVTTVEQRLDALVSARKWASKDVWVVNQREPPHWDLGLNLVIPSGRALSATFLEDVTAIAKELGGLHRETGQAFVLGFHDAASDDVRDLFTVDSDEPDVESIRASFRTSLQMK